jgi:MacB-like periplasmic core domain
VEQRGRGYNALLDLVSDDYFHALEIPLEGRDFSRRDAVEGPKVIIVDRATERLLGPDSAIRKIISLRKPGVLYEIVGVAGRVHLFGNPKDISPHVYLPTSQSTPPFFTLVIKTKLRAGELAPTLGQTVGRVDPLLVLGTLAPLTERIDAQISGPRFHLIMICGLGTIALMLAVFGVFSVTKYAVSLRKREFAIRKSLGARPGGLVWVIVTSGVKLLPLGLSGGSAAAILTARSLASAFSEVNAGDWSAFAASAALVTVAFFFALSISACEIFAIDSWAMLRPE